ncbi:hypothetical protein QE152_g35691 [Popillia japonica]|uniref:Transposase n=1 Tax=Popillia japonica TaxID=7064 RepID=A0AAW1IF97_POPJA
MTDRVPCGKSVTAAYYHYFLQKLGRKMHKNRPQLLNDTPLILYDNARPHIGHVVTEKLREYGWEVLPHPPYSLDMSPPDFDLFPNLKKTYAWTSFSIAGRAFYHRYPSYPTDEQRWYPQWYSKASHSLGFDH